MFQNLYPAAASLFETERQAEFRRLVNGGMLPSEASPLAYSKASTLAAERNATTMAKVLHDQGGPLSGQEP